MSVEERVKKITVREVGLEGCWNAGKRSRGVTREQAPRAPAEDVPPRPQCRPDTELGLLD